MSKKLSHTIRLFKVHAEQFKQKNNKVMYQMKRQEIDNQEYALFSLYNQIILGTSIDDYISKINHVGSIVHPKKKNKYFPTISPFRIDKYGEILYVYRNSKYIVEPAVFDKRYDTIQQQIKFNGRKNTVRSHLKNLSYIRILMEMMKDDM